MKLSKGDFMKAVYTTEELRNIDSATPIHCWEKHQPSYHVMNYNKSSIFGELENLFIEGAKRGIDLKKYKHLIDKSKFKLISFQVGSKEIYEQVFEVQNFITPEEQYDALLDGYSISDLINQYKGVTEDRQIYLG
jgi:hypothetical protein